MKHAQLIATKITDAGIWVMVRIKVGQVTTDRKVLVHWGDLDLSDVAEGLDRQARRALVNAWSDVPLPIDFADE